MRTRIVAIATFVFSIGAGGYGAASDKVVYTESFNGGHSPNDPGPPQSFNPQNWDIQTHIRSAHSTPGVTVRHEADHGANCEAPGDDGAVTHAVSKVEDTTYQCANHIMSSFRADDFGQIAMTPPALVDFSDGEATIKFDMSTLSDSPRDWPSLVIQNYADNLALPLEAHWPDLNGFSKSAVLFDFRDGVVCPVIFRNFKAAEGANKFESGCRWWDSVENHIAPSAQTRRTFVVTISRTRIRVEIPELDLVFADYDIPDLGWDQGLVSLLHHSYDPLKGGGKAPNTWHFDNLEINPARPITIIQSPRRWANEDGAAFDFGEPAPANSYLRGTAIGTKLEVSFDDGRSWTVASQQPSELQDKPVWQFWHAIPEGVSSVKVRQGDPSVAWWPSNWIAKDLSIFSTSADFEPAPEEPAPTLKECRRVNVVQERDGGKWVRLDRKVDRYFAADCLAPR